VSSNTYSNFEETEKRLEAYGYVDLEKFRKVLEEENFTVKIFLTIINFFQKTYYKEGILCVNNIFFVKKVLMIKS